MDTAGDLAEKYEECCDRRDVLSKRLEVVMKHAQSKATVLSKVSSCMNSGLLPKSAHALSFSSIGVGDIYHRWAMTSLYYSILV